MASHPHSREPSAPAHAVYDPVCGMNLAGMGDLREKEHGGTSYYFCGDGCFERFEDEPERFLGVPLIKLRNISKRYVAGVVEAPVLRGLDLNIWEGDFVAVIGASGSGKSTLLNMLGLLDLPTSGDIFYKGKNIALLKEDERAAFRSTTFGFVFQQYNLIPWLTAYENALVPLIFAGRREQERELAGRFREVGLGERTHHRPFELSGGEQQRVALVRALANDPSVILGDEPTGNLDSATGHLILEKLIGLNRERGKTLIIVTHDSSIAEQANEIITIQDGRTLRDHHIHKKRFTGA